MFWLIGTVFALRNFLTLTAFGGFTRLFREHRDLLVFGGVWALGQIPRPNQQKQFDPKKSKKNKLFFSFVPVSKNEFLSKNGAMYSSSSAPGAPCRGRAH